MNKILLVLLLACFCNEIFSQDYYVTLNNDTMPCKFKDISQSSVKLRVAENNPEKFKPNEMKSFCYNGILFHPRKLWNDSEKNELIFYPDIKVDTVIDDKIAGFTITTNGINTVYAASCIAHHAPAMDVNGFMYGGGSVVIYQYYIENEKLGLREIPLPENLYSHKGFASIELLKEYLADNPELQSKIHKPTHQVSGSKVISNYLKQYFGKDVVRKKENMKKTKVLSSKEQNVQVSDTTSVQ